jgi:single-strand DNA-binding protein
MSGHNFSALLGRLVSSPEELQTKNGKLFVKAIIAASVYRQTADGKSEERTSFIPVTIFGRQAQVFLEHVHKGDLVHLVGRLESNEWKTNSGEKRLSLSFVVEQLNLLPNERAKPKPAAEAKRPGQTERNDDDEPDDIPF